MSKSFEALQKHAINLELDLQQCKEKIKNDKSFKENQSNVFLKEREQYFEIQDLKAQLQDKGIAISELKKLIEKMKGKYVETKFEKSSVIRQPNAFKSQRQSILGKPTIFSDSLAKKDFSKSKPVTTQNVSNDFSKPVTAQILPQNMLPIVKNTNVIAPGMYKPKSNQLEDRVMSNNSQGKEQKVEDHRRNFKFSNNKTFVTACNDSLNAKTLNVNFGCSISTREAQANVNNSATSSKKTVATDSTIKKSRNITRKLYEQVSKTCSWWYPKYTPPGYNWKPKSQKGNVNPNISMPLGNASRTANILEHKTPRCSKHMTENLKLLTNFVEKFLGTVKFGNDQIAPILGYGDLVQGTITIKRVYYVEGLNHNLFSGNDLSHSFLVALDLVFHSSARHINSQSICLMAKATSSQAWLWHRRLSHLNFDTINLLSKNNIVNGLPKLKFVKDHLCSSCELGKAKRKSFHTKTTPSSKRRLQLLHMDLCGPMRVESINGNNIGIKTPETSTARTPEQNGVVKRRNRTLVEAARTMLKERRRKDGENLDKLKEKGMHVFFVGMASDHVSSDPGPQCSTTVLEQDSLSPGPQSQENVLKLTSTVTTSNEMELLYSPMFNELLNGTTPVVSKSSLYML
ncbi:retrovirus-related pol polyprotein from transposon TNT 1-94 [Tanacetum coccineum]|uniref:Retrovirus-related pol polyprotein from transposon TNT 1-94 n=1 Tax=Tanacetum coccineum TaxID=301880 RepID=A0ABQ5DD75_9ASTR